MTAAAAIKNLTKLGYTVTESHPSREATDSEPSREAILHIAGHGISHYVEATDLETLQSLSDPKAHAQRTKQLEEHA